MDYIDVAPPLLNLIYLESLILDTDEIMLFGALEPWHQQAQSCPTCQQACSCLVLQQMWWGNIQLNNLKENICDRKYFCKID